MLAFEPVRRGVSKAFISARAGLVPTERDMAWRNRAEARMFDQIEFDRLFDVTRQAALEAVFNYPSRPPKKFFPWLRETIAHRALDHLRGELREPETEGRVAAEARALQDALGGFERAEGPATSERSGKRAWLARIEMRDVFNIVESFFESDAVRDVCQAAIGRLPRAEREVIAGYFFEEKEVADLAVVREVNESTIYNQKAKAQARLHDDDVFFGALQGLARVRDRARAEALAEAHPGGLMPDGRRRIIAIDQAA
jgi:RNA polymerase sigma factor (sigma-70 family)